MYSKEKHLTDFIDAPSGLTRTDIELPLKNSFPECKVTWKWFIQSYRIRWA